MSSADDVSRETSGIDLEQFRVNPGPTLVMEGKYALYETPGGGFHLVYRPDSDEEDHHFEIPAAAVTLMNTVGGGNPGGMLGKMISRFLPKGVH